MGRSRMESGRAAERRVDRAARRRGWRCVERNYRVRGGELDMVYLHNDLLIVVEVRFRSRRDYGDALASVTPAKQRRIVMATRHLLSQYPHYAHKVIRFDVVGVDQANNLDWIEGAFYAE